MRIVGVVDEARAVLTRIERIEALEREGASPERLLAELRQLAREAAEWARVEGDPAAQAAAAACARALADLHATPAR